MTKKRQTKQSSTHRSLKSTHWQASLKTILSDHNPVAAWSGKAASYATQAARRQGLWQGFKRLKVLGYKLKDVRNFKEKHLKALAQDWEAQGLSPSRLQNNISIFRTFSGWIGKPGMIRASHHYVKQAQSVKRQTTTRTDKTWSGQGVDIAKQLNKVAGHDPAVSHDNLLVKI